MSAKDIKITEQQSEIAKHFNSKAEATDGMYEDERHQDTKRILENVKNDNGIRLASSEQVAMEKRTSKLYDIAKVSNNLILKVLNPDKSNKNISLLKINAMGLINSKRNSKDGCVYFGYIPENHFNIKDNIDVNVPVKLTENIIDQKSIGRHFQIEFKIDNNKYCIRDLGIGFGTFAKLDFPLILKDNHLIHIGESYIVVNIIEQFTTANSLDTLEMKNNINIQLKLKLFGVNNKGETFVFPSSKNCITIGRFQQCDVQIMDKLLSKYHCFIKFNDKDGWTLYDGKDSQHPSTNGTWLFTNEDFEIYDRLVFKSNQTVFQVSKSCKNSVFCQKIILSNEILYKIFLINWNNIDSYSFDL